ncbi:MAG: O-antigen ligase family protein [Pirellula sp.]|nr:O-antigen ligase family protein [Pirellula sp.]
MSTANNDLQKPSFVLALPDKISQGLLGLYLFISQWNPCDATGVMSGNSLALIVLGLAIGFCTAAARACNPQWKGIPHLFSALVLVFCIWLAICEIVALAGGSNGQTALLGFWQTIAIVGVTSACVHHAADPLRLAAMARWILGLAVGSSVYALYQFMVSMPRIRSQFKDDPTPFLQSEGIEQGTAMALQFYNRVMSAEPMGPFNLTNSLAGFVAPWSVVACLAGVWYFFRKDSDSSSDRNASSGIPHGNPRFYLALIGGVVVLLGMALLLTKSRTAWIAMLAGLLMIVCMYSKIVLQRNSLKWVIAALAAIAIPFGFVVWRDPLIVLEAGKSLAYRADYWNGAMQLIGRSPWFGYGSLNFQSVYPHVKSITASETPADPHNMWIEIATDAGLPGLMITILGSVYLTISGIRHWRYPSQQSSDGKWHQQQARATHPIAWISIGMMVASVATLGMTLLFSSDLDTAISCFLFVSHTAIVASMLRSEIWVRFVTENMSMLGFLVCTVTGLHLCFSGGWMQPGTMNTAAVAIALILVGQSRNLTSTFGVSKHFPVLSFGGWIVACGAFAYSTYVPEVRLASWENEMQFTDPLRLDLESVESALALHRFSPVLADRILGICSVRIMDSRISSGARNAWFAVYERARRELLERDRNQPNSKDRCVEWDLQLVDFLETREPDRSLELLARAKTTAEEAVSQYPSSIQLQLQAAVLEAQTGEWKEASDRLDIVEEIDIANPHLDRKLRLAAVRVPRGSHSIFGTFQENDRVAGAPNQVRGEPLFQRLRSLPQMSKSRTADGL